MTVGNERHCDVLEACLGQSTREWFPRINAGERVCDQETRPNSWIVGNPSLIGNVGFDRHSGAIHFLNEYDW
jgi:hypothetical protein